jgi:hypothetical protein
MQDLVETGPHVGIYTILQHKNIYVYPKDLVLLNNDDHNRIVALFELNHTRLSNEMFYN